MNKEKTDLLIGEMISLQKDYLLKCARRIVPSITMDDILQPNDFPELEQHPHFRYEEGVLAGMLAVQAAIRSKF